MSTPKIFAGKTVPKETAWKPYGSTGIEVWVDTSVAEFSKTPLYFASIGGEAGHWALTGSNAVYNPRKNGFRIYLRWPHGGAITPDYANAKGWHISWCGIEFPASSRPDPDESWVVPPLNVGENPTEMPKT
ncbi:MAG: hypothetical protein ACOYLU_09300 [Limisphaerales bacterium]